MGWLAEWFSGLEELTRMPVLKAALAAVTSFVLTAVGHPESAAKWLLGLMLTDLCLGLMRAWVGEGFRAAKLSKGAKKFFFYWVAVAIFSMTSAALPKQFGMLLRDGFIGYLAVNEALSCVVHLSFFGFPVPEPFLRRLKGYRDACANGEWNGEERREEGKSQEQQEEGEE